MKAEEDQAGNMPLMEHLSELRRRLIVIAAGVLTAAAGAFSFSDEILHALTAPLGTDLYFLAPTEAFWVSLKISLVAGLLLVLPLVLHQIWRFIAPGLYRTERRYGAVFVLTSYLFFLIGLAFCGLVALPFALKFLIGFGIERGIKPMISADHYIDFTLKFYLAFGLIFEVPLAVTLGSRLGLVTPAFLSRNRRYALLMNSIVAAILTPTSDLFNMAIMLVPLTLLYELGILGARVFGRRKPVPDPAGAEA